MKRLLGHSSSTIPQHSDRHVVVGGGGGLAKRTDLNIAAAEASERMVMNTAISTITNAPLFPDS
jgi:hypothetical protein